jgi:hypothetical protein
MGIRILITWLDPHSNIYNNEPMVLNHKETTQQT